MRYLIAFLLVAMAATCFAAQPAFADKRVALVIGNGAYANEPHLPNPSHDAEDVAAALKRSGFDVILGTDLGQSGMEDVTIKFARTSRAADVAVFYYSGHAMQFNGVNYLMPVDAKLDDEADLKRMTRVDEILDDLQQAKNLRILVLDSCRDNPLADTLKRSIGLTRGASIQRGLTKMEAPLGTIISFSTQAGRTANDGDGRNSPYTTAFLKHIEEPSEIGDVFREVSDDVYQTSDKTQLPELSLSIIGKFYLNGPVSVTINPPAQLAPVDPCAAAEAHWKAADSIGTIAAYEDHITRFPRCAFADLARDRIDALKQKTALTSPATAPTGNANTAQGFIWRGMFSCDKLSFTRGPQNVPIEVTIADASATFSHKVYNQDNTRVIGTEEGTGTVASDGVIRLSSVWKSPDPRYSYTGSYSGTLSNGSGSLRGTQIWSFDGKTENRSCSIALKK